MISNIPLLIGCAIVAAVSIPLILKAVPPNQIYGFRTSKTLSNESLWYRANVFAGWALLIAAIVGAALLCAMESGALPSVAPGVAVFVAPLVIAVVACVIYLAMVGNNLPSKGN